MSVVARSLSPKGSSDSLFTTSKGLFGSLVIAAAAAAGATEIAAAVAAALYRGYIEVK